MPREDIEAACVSLATHPDQQALKSVKRQLQSKFNIPQEALNIVAEHLELRSNQKQQLGVALFGSRPRSSRVEGFVLRIAACFADAFGKFYGPWPGALDAMQDLVLDRKAHEPKPPSAL